MNETPVSPDENKNNKDTTPTRRVGIGISGGLIALVASKLAPYKDALYTLFDK